ncbi:hypothetical protein Tco_0714463, partial [Tanacetum coccineum]
MKKMMRKEGGQRKEFLDSKVALAQVVQCIEICYIQSRRKYRYSNREGCCEQQDSKQCNIDFLFSVENATTSTTEVKDYTTFAMMIFASKTKGHLPFAMRKERKGSMITNQSNVVSD